MGKASRYAQGKVRNRLPRRPKIPAMPVDLMENAHSLLHQFVSRYLDSCRHPVAPFTAAGPYDFEADVRSVVKDLGEEIDLTAMTVVAQAAALRRLDEEAADALFTLTVASWYADLGQVLFAMMGSVSGPGGHRQAVRAATRFRRDVGRSLVEDYGLTLEAAGIAVSLAYSDVRRAIPDLPPRGINHGYRRPVKATTADLPDAAEAILAKQVVSV